MLRSTDLNLFVTFWLRLRIATRNPPSLVLVSLKLSSCSTLITRGCPALLWLRLTQTEKVRAVKIKLITCSLFECSRASYSS